VAGDTPDGRTSSEPELYQLLRAGPGLSVLTGGQTGVDTLAAQAALDAVLSVHLVFPRGYRREDGPLTPERRALLTGAHAHQLPTASFRSRTWACVALADVVVLLDPAGGSGCEETRRAAAQLCPDESVLIAAQVSEWLRRNEARVLMVAGCRASVLERAGKDRELPAQLAVIMAGARAYADALIRLPGIASDSTEDPPG